MACLDAQALFDLFHGGRAHDRVEVDLHLDTCGACRSLVATYGALRDGTETDATLFAPTDPSPPGMATGGSEAARPARPGDLLSERYTLERVVGEGGMGVVWAARDALDGRTVAIKLLKSVDPTLCRRFAREAKIASALQHPHIASVRSIFGQADGSPALVMDLLEGESLAHTLASRGRFDAATTIRVLLPLVSAVRAAHSRGVIHRDLKPQNVFLARDASAPHAEPIVMLLDFGLAKLVGVDDEAAETITRTGTVIGTPHYMAPEQLFGEKAIDARADIWSIGAIAYELLSTKKPLDGKSYGQLVKRATKGPVAPLLVVEPSVPTSLAALVDTMLAIDPAARPRLADVHATLDALYEGAGAG